jgi:hypothetical protein
MKCRILLVIIFIGNSFITLAQDSLSDAITKQAAENSIKSKLTSPFGAAALSNFVSNISVSSFFKEGVNGKIELRGKFKAGWTGGLSIDQKIGKTSEEAAPLSLTGISPGTTVQLNLQKMCWHPSFDMSDDEVRKLNSAEEAYAKRNNIDDAHTVGLRDISINGNEMEKKMALDAFNTIHFREPFFVNAATGFTKTSFLYTTDSVNLIQVSDAYVTPTFTISVIKALGSGFKVAGYIAISYNYSEIYTAADNITFNIPFGTTSNYYSNTLAFGTPRKQTINTLIGEYRQNIFIKNGNVSNIAISPSINWNIDGKMLGAFLPVYFIRGADEKGKLLDGLQGGMRFGYITSTEKGNATNFSKGFTAQLIISAPLDFLNNL